MGYPAYMIWRRFLDIDGDEICLGTAILLLFGCITAGYFALIAGLVAHVCFRIIAWPGWGRKVKW